MPDSEHPSSPLGRSFLMGGIVLGLLLIAALFTRGFGLFGSGDAPVTETPGIVHNGDTVQIPEGSALRQRIGVAAAAVEDLSPKLELPGAVESDPARTANILPPLSGRVIELKVALGDTVHAGQVLAVIDSPDLGQAYDDNDKAADTAALTEKNLTRQEEQFKLGTASARDLDQARSDHAQAAAEYARTRARLNVIGVAAKPVPGVRTLPIKSPVNGTITSLSTAPGVMINDPTQPIMAVADLSMVWVTALVPENEVAGIDKSQAAEVRLDAYPGKIFSGKILFVSAVIEPDSRRDKVRIGFDNAAHLLKPNMFATVTLVGRPQSHIVLPTSALLMNNDRTTVFVETAPWTFKRRIVEPQLEEGPSVTIDSGVQAGEKVVVKGGILLND